jgi:hypothetical protein
VNAGRGQTVVSGRIAQRCPREMGQTEIRDGAYAVITETAAPKEAMFTKAVTSTPDVDPFQTGALIFC